MIRTVTVQIVRETVLFCGAVYQKEMQNMQKKDAYIAEDTEQEALADFFKVFGDKTRIRILCILGQKELCVQELADALSMTHSAVSHQLRILKQMKLVANRRDGKTVYYSLADDHIGTILCQGLEHVRE